MEIDIFCLILIDASMKQQKGTFLTQSHSWFKIIILLILKKLQVTDFFYIRVQREKALQEMLLSTLKTNSNNFFTCLKQHPKLKFQFILPSNGHRAQKTFILQSNLPLGWILLAVQMLLRKIFQQERRISPCLFFVELQFLVLFKHLG